MKRIGKGDYAWSTRRADLKERAAVIGLQAAGYAAEGDTMMAAGTASLAGRCALDFTDAETREQTPRGNDVHYADDSTRGRPLCGQKASSPYEKPATTRSERRTDCWKCRERLKTREREPA